MPLSRISPVLPFRMVFSGGMFREIPSAKKTRFVVIRRLLLRQDQDGSHLNHPGFRDRIARVLQIKSEGAG
jgi:hypothetical protein